MRWILWLLKVLGFLREGESLIEEARDIAAGTEPAAPAAGPPRDPTDKDNKFHLNQ